MLFTVKKNFAATPQKSMYSFKHGVVYSNDEVVLFMW